MKGWLMLYEKLHSHDSSNDFGFFLWLCVFSLCFLLPFIMEQGAYIMWLYSGGSELHPTLFVVAHSGRCTTLSYSLLCHSQSFNELLQCSVFEKGTFPCIVRYFRETFKTTMIQKNGSLSWIGGNNHQRVVVTEVSCHRFHCVWLTLYI